MGEEAASLELEMGIEIFINCRCNIGAIELCKNQSIVAAYPPQIVDRWAHEGESAQKLVANKKPR